VFLTLGDVDRITALGAGQFTTYAAPNQDYYIPDCDPWWGRIFHPDGTRRIIVKQEDSNFCLFLGETGCRLGIESRPLVCRLYPFEYDHNCIKGVTAHLCPSPERDNPPLILALLNMNRDQAENWRSQLYREIQAEFS
jgi:Fe-S-cluster containining protein